MKQIIDRIRAALKDHPFDAVLLTSPQNRFYATGFPSSAGIALITLDNAYFATDFRYFEDAGKKIEGFELEMVKAGHSYHDVINAVIQKESIARIGFEDNAMTYSEYLAKKNALQAELVPMGDMMAALRMIKLPHEIERIEAAQRIAEESFEALLPDIRVGATEAELAAKLIYYMALRGSEKPSFDPIVVSGANGSLCHGHPTEKPIAAGDFITFDFGATYRGYCSDMTRTVAVGQPSDEMVQVYQTVLKAQNEAIAAAKAGIIGADLDRVARDIIKDAGYGEYFGHGLGHGLGIDVHDAGSASPAYAKSLPANFVCTIEPGIYIPGKFGVRIEDFVLLTDDGCVNITKAPKELLIL